jgi:ATP/ADP translocase
MPRLIRWLNVDKDEMALFLWTGLLLFLIRSSGLLFNNFAETAFLKRFGVEYLPIITAINAVATFIVMGFLSGLIARIPGARLLAYVLVFCAVSVGALRFVVPLEIDLLYPVLYILKTQYEVLLVFLFWNLANDLFDTRQSKRIFPLVTAGGIVGAILGSLCTPLLAKQIPLNDLLLAYSAVALMGAATAHKMGTLFPAALFVEKTVGSRRARSSIIQQVKMVLPLVRESALAKALILLTLLPNVVIPIITYQFSYVVDQTFASEGTMIDFYGYFRGVQNGVALVVSLFVGRIYGRFGIPVALMFHPFNYVLAFLAYLLQFNIFSAIYATLSTGVLRIAVNGPANAVLYGLFRRNERAVIRPFLRGTVVRAGILAGSAVVYLSGFLFHPRYLSLIAVTVVSLWIGATFYLRRQYADILVRLIRSDTFDPQALEPSDAREIFGDECVRAQLIETFRSSRGEVATWYAALLRSLGGAELDTMILEKILSEDDATREALLPFLSDRAGPQAVPVFRDLIDPKKPALMIAFARTARRVYPDMPLSLQQEVFELAVTPEMKACAVVGLLHQAPETYQPIIDGWLRSDLLAERRAGVMAAGESERQEYVPQLCDMLEAESDPTVIPLLLGALRRLGMSGLNARACRFLDHPSVDVRLAALETLDLEDIEAVRAVIPLMGDHTDAVRDRAIEILEHCPARINPVLVEFLGSQSRRVRDGIFRLAESLDVTDVEVFNFCRGQLMQACELAADQVALEQLPEGRARELLAEHLDQMRLRRVENVLRALVARDASGEMKAIWHGALSENTRLKANSLEALETKLDRALSRILIPALEARSAEELLAVGRKHWEIRSVAVDGADLVRRLLDQEDPITTLFTLHLAATEEIGGVDAGALLANANFADLEIHRLTRMPGSREGGEMDTFEQTLSIPDKVVQLRGVEIFAGLSVAELAAIASITEEVTHPAETVFHREGDSRDTLYLVVSGEVAIQQNRQGDAAGPVELIRLGRGEAFGLPYLFYDCPISVNAQTTEDTTFLTLNRDDFAGIAREYPEVPLQICGTLAKRLNLAINELQGAPAGAA